MPISIQEQAFEDVGVEWEAILSSCVTNNVFVTPHWSRIWWQHFGRGSKKCLLRVSDGDELIGIAPLKLGQDLISFLGDADLCDYLDFIVPIGKESIFYRALCDHLMSLDWQKIELTHLPQDSPTLKYLPSFMKEKSVHVEIIQANTTPVATLPSSWDEYLTGLTKKARHEIRRKLRRLNRADNPRQYVCASADTLKDSMQDFFRLMRGSSLAKTEFLTPEREAFFVDVGLELASRDQFKVHVLEINGQPVASCLVIDYGDSSLLYNSGYDPNYSELSVGLLNKALSVKDAIEAGKQFFNFLNGAERYKYELGGKDNPVYTVLIQR